MKLPNNIYPAIAVLTILVSSLIYRKKRNSGNPVSNIRITLIVAIVLLLVSVFVIHFGDKF